MKHRVGYLVQQISKGNGAYRSFLAAVMAIQTGNRVVTIFTESIWHMTIPAFPVQAADTMIAITGAVVKMFR